MGETVTNRYAISHYDGPRLADELVIYRAAGTVTGTNAYGLEAVTANGRVVSVGSNNNTVPADGFVISGHGKGRDAVLAICVGAKACIEGDTLVVTVDDDARLYASRLTLDKIKARFEERVAEGDFDFQTAFTLIESAEKAIAGNDAAKADSLLEESYYVTAAVRKDEIRAIWHRPSEHTADEVRKTVRRLKDTGFNMLLIETNYEGYANAPRCVYDWLPVRPGYENFDVIGEFIDACHAEGMKIHAWLEDFFIGVDKIPCRIAELRPDLIARTKNGGMLVDGWDNFIFLNPALDEVHDMLAGMYRDIIESYDFDGIQLDYIRYPVIKDINRSAGFEPQTKAMFLADTGIDVDSIASVDAPEWAEFNRWRAERVTAYVRKIVGLVGEYRAKGRNILLSTAVFGNPDEAIRLKCQNWLYWVKSGWLDLIFPMAYLNDADDVGREISYMVTNYGEAPNVSGISPMYGHLPVIESTKQVEACRAAGAAGVAFFETVALTDIQAEKLKIGVFRK